MTFIEFELRSLWLWLPLSYGQTVVPFPPLLDAIVFVFVEDAGVEFMATQVAVHDVWCSDQTWVFWCFCRVLRDRDCQGACRGQTLSSVQ